MLDIYQLAANSPGPQHFTPIAVLKLWKMEEKKGLLALLRSEGTRLLNTARKDKEESCGSMKCHTRCCFSFHIVHTETFLML